MEEDTTVTTAQLEDANVGRKDFGRTQQSKKIKSRPAVGNPHANQIGFKIKETFEHELINTSIQHRSAQRCSPELLQNRYSSIHIPQSCSP